MRAGGVYRRSFGAGAAFAGRGEISGPNPLSVTVAGAAASRKVYLIDRALMKMIRVGRSGQDGFYRFVGLDVKRQFIVLARDDLLQFDAVIRDNITPAEEA